MSDRELRAAGRILRGSPELASRIVDGWSREERAALLSALMPPEVMAGRHTLELGPHWPTVHLARPDPSLTALAGGLPVGLFVHACGYRPILAEELEASETSTTKWGEVTCMRCLELSPRSTWLGLIQA